MWRCKKLGGLADGIPLSAPGRLLCLALFQVDFVLMQSPQRDSRKALGYVGIWGMYDAGEKVEDEGAVQMVRMTAAEWSSSGQAVPS